MRRLSRIQVWIPSELVAEMRTEAERVFPLETGGVLMGYWADSHAVVITTLVGPGPLARHRRRSFAPDYDFQDARVADVYGESAGTTTYLGDWHSHPGGTTMLSRKDRRLLAAMARHEVARTPQPAMGILAGESEWNLAVWVRRKIGLLGASHRCDLRVFRDERVR